MSGDSATLEEVEEQEMDLVGLLAKQGEGDEIDDDDEIEGEIPSDPKELRTLVETLKERVSKRNKSLKKAKEAQHRTEQEKNDILARLEAMDKKIESSRQSSQGAAELERQAQEWAEKVELDPTKAIEYADWKQEQLEGKIANYLGNELKSLRDEIAALKGATNPEMLQYKTEVDMLRGNPDFAALDDATLLNLARGLRKAAPKKPRGGIGGQRAVADKGGSKLSKEDEARIREAVRNG